MKAKAYYNEIDAACCAVLLEQEVYGVIAPGKIDSRSIKEVTANDVAGFTQCHWFAGGGLWSVAARLAGWPDDRPLWTASCPCQPFSGAGKGAGFDDPRHLWPDLFRIVRAARPPVLVGEQVASAPGYNWLDRVFADLETEGYACRAVDIPACAVDAPISEIASIGAPWPTVTASNKARSEEFAKGRAPNLAEIATWPTPAVADVTGGRKTRSGDRSDEMLLNGLLTASWATPRQGNGGFGNPTRATDGKARLEDQIYSGVWSTPRASDGEKGGPNQSFGAGGQPLPAQMHQATWSTVRTSNVNATLTGTVRAERDLTTQMHQASNWPTPSARDWRSDRSQQTSEEIYGTKGRPLSRTILEASGEIQNGSPATIIKRGAPNPEFAFWLMGFPDAWICGALRAMRSFRKKPRKPSER